MIVEQIDWKPVRNILYAKHTSNILASVNSASLLRLWLRSVSQTIILRSTKEVQRQRQTLVPHWKRKRWLDG